MRLLARLRYIQRRRARRRHLAALPTGDADPVVFTDADSEVLLVAFGGMNRQIGIPPFEFMKLTGSIPVKRLFVRDPRQAWYHRGLPGRSRTLEETLGVLRELTGGAERLIVTGNSAGGYAALLFGSLLGADQIVCFAPQSTLNLDTLHSIGDHRWDDHLRPLHKAHVMDARWLDLQVLAPRENVQIYFDKGLEVDRLHAERIAHVGRLYPCEGGQHELVRTLRDRGELAGILEAALAHQPAPDSAL
ncbi:MAG TPA: hypothetical protein VGO14_11680 [Solirubrobacteraceae bacterium]|jgi:hypothetical protein|nr:hypothetical protein [Solirubrobacteraceae bacterium]